MQRAEKCGEGGQNTETRAPGVSELAEWLELVGGDVGEAGSFRSLKACHEGLEF